MIRVHKLKGEPVWVNPDLIASVDGGHESVLTFTDGRHMVVIDPPEEIAAAIRVHRAQILALAFRLEPNLEVVTDAFEGGPSDTLRHLQPVPEV